MQNSRVPAWWRAECLELMFETDPQKLWKRERALVKRAGRGFRWVGTLTVAGRLWQPPILTDWNDLPSGWAEIAGWEDSAVSLRHFQRSDEPFRIPSPTELDQVPEWERPWWRACHALGIYTGTNVISRTRANAVMVAAMRERDAIGEEEHAQVVLMLKYLSAILVGILPNMLTPGANALEAAGVEPLTRKQFDNLRYLALGKTMVETAALMHVSPDAIKAQRKELVRKLRANDPIHAVGIAVSLKILQKHEL